MFHGKKKKRKTHVRTKEILCTEVIGIASSLSDAFNVNNLCFKKKNCSLLQHQKNAHYFCNDSKTVIFKYKIRFTAVFKVLLTRLFISSLV
jgi:ribosomal protein L16 Arg81 hydroxylase